MIAALVLAAAAAAGGACPLEPPRVVESSQSILPADSHPTHGRVSFLLDLGSDGRVRRSLRVESSGDAAVDAAAETSLQQTRFAPPSYNCYSISTATTYGYDIPPELLTSPTPAASPLPSSAPACVTPFARARRFGLAPHRTAHGTAVIDVSLDALARVTGVNLVQSSGDRKADYAAAVAARHAPYAFEHQPGCTPRATTYRLEITFR